MDATKLIEETEAELNRRARNDAVFSRLLQHSRETESALAAAQAERASFEILAAGRVDGIPDGSLAGKVRDIIHQKDEWLMDSSEKTRAAMERMAAAAGKPVRKCSDYPSTYGASTYGEMAEEIADHVCSALAAAQAENERLRAIVAALPKTRDGVPIVPGMIVHYLPGHDGFSGPHRAKILGVDGASVKIQIGAADDWFWCSAMSIAAALAPATEGR